MSSFPSCPDLHEGFAYQVLFSTDQFVTPCTAPSAAALDHRMAAAEVHWAIALLRQGSWVLHHLCNDGSAGKDVGLATHELDAETMEMGLIAGLGARSRRRYYRRLEARSDAMADEQQSADAADSMPSDHMSGGDQLPQTASERDDGSGSDEGGSDENDGRHESSSQIKYSADSRHAEQPCSLESGSQQAAVGGDACGAVQMSAEQPVAADIHQQDNQPQAPRDTCANPRISAFADEDGGDSLYANCHPESSQHHDPTSNSLSPESDPAELSDAVDPAQHLSAAASLSDAPVEGRQAARQRTPCNSVSRKNDQAAPGQSGGGKLLDRPGRAAASRRARWTAANGHLALQDDRKLSTDSASHMLHGKLVVAACQERAGTDGISQLATRFRKAFVQALHPAFLPPAWEIDHSYATCSAASLPLDGSASKLSCLL